MAARWARALAGHAGQLGLASVQLAGRPSPTGLATTLDCGTKATELTEAVATASDHS
jgi:hypothetical protein